MKNRKRNLTMLAVLMFVCAAVALNWSYNNRWGTPDSEMVSAEDEAMMSANAEFADNLMNTGSEYFAEARLTRQVSRDEALELLQTAATSEHASQETIDSACQTLLSRIPLTEGIRLIGVTASNLGAPLSIPSLFSDQEEKRARAARAMDSIQQKYGRKALRKGFWLEK